MSEKDKRIKALWDEYHKLLDIIDASYDEYNSSDSTNGYVISYDHNGRRFYVSVTGGKPIREE